ncbi:MAG: TonB-dependent receptor [Flavobacteriaceae bacterium]|nr:TonB-dependent receptor [Flavobacteriaceae bacterium]
MRNKIAIAYCFLTLFQGISIFGQKVDADRSLLPILIELQEKYQVQFNYASELIENIRIPSPDTSLSLQEVLTFLGKQTGLDFLLVNNTIISIKARQFVLCGNIRDKESDEPLPYTTVQSNGRGTVTDEAGYFELRIYDISDIVLIRHYGHRTIRREFRLFEREDCSIVYLTPEQQRLPEIVLSQYLIQGIDKLDNGSIQVDFDRFSILPGLVEEDVLQSVQALPGILSIDETVSNINIRGGSNDQNLILWDDIKMYQSGHFFGLISMYNPQITQNVALQKNGSPVHLTDGVSGTIAMNTDNNINPDINGSLGMNLIDANGFIDVPLGQNASIQVAARKAITDFFETPTYSEYLSRISQGTEIETNDETVVNSNISFDFYDASFRLLFKPSDKDLLRLNFIHTADEVVFNESALVASDEKIRESNLNQNSIAGGIHYSRQWNLKFSTELSLYETDYKLKAINANVLQDQRFLQENIVSETGIRIISKNKVFENAGWQNGYQFTETKITNLDDVDDPIFRNLEGEVLRSHGIFTEFNWAPVEKTTLLNAGLRYNYLVKFRKSIWEPRLSFNQRFLRWFNLEILGEFKHQSTSQVINFQTDFFGVEKRRWQLSNNEDIPVIQSKQASLGLSYQRKGWLLNAVGFIKTISGITSQSQGFLDRFQFERTSGEYDAYGIDFLMRKQFDNWNTWLSYGFLNNTYHFEELSENDFQSNFDVTHSLSSGITFSTRNLSFAAGANWHTGKPYTPPIPGVEVQDDAINYDSANSARVPDYLRLDLSALYKIDIKENSRIHAGVSVWNILNRKNTINTFYRVNNLGNAQQNLQQSLGITPNATIKLFLD